MGSETISEETLKCGCVHTRWMDDWLNGGVYKTLCKKHQLEKDQREKTNKIKLENMEKQYEINKSKSLVNDMIQLQKELGNGIFCPCCKKQYLTINLNRHVESKGHQSKLDKLKK